MSEHTFNVYEEIVSQTEAWAEALDVVEKKKKALAKLNLDEYRQVLFLGCGSTYYLSLSASSLFQNMTGVVSKALPSSEALLFPESAFCGGGTLLVAISRSGLTSETLHSVETFKEMDLGKVIAITNYGDSPLAKLSDINIVISSGQEESVAQTRSFASMFVAITALSYVLGSEIDFSTFRNDLVLAGERLINDCQEFSKNVGMDSEIKQIFYLGSGTLYGLACEASLKMKEMSQTVTEAYHFFEFRHGPISMVDQNTLVVGLVSEIAGQHERAVISDVEKFRAQTVTLGETDADIEFESGLPEEARYVLYLPALQLLAFFRAVSKGKNPDNPQNITSVVELDLKI